MSYKGIEFTSQDNYIFEDILPYNRDFNMEELKTIQTKLQNFTSGISLDGLTSQEAETFLDWITFNARSYAVHGTPESAITSSMTGQCAPTQRINVTLLRKFGLDARPFNTADCIGEIPLSEDDKKRIENGWNSPAVRHSVSLVNIPIIDNYGNTESYKFLLDPTFKQFCLKENCDSNKFFDQNYISRGYVAPHPGYFMQQNNLTNSGVSADIAQKTESLGKYIVSKGYFYLNEENAKLYGDAFVRASTRIEFQNQPINMSGEQYIKNFENIPMQMLGNNQDDSNFLKLPSELEKKTIFSKIQNFFNKLFGNKTKMLPSGNSSIINEKPSNTSSKLQSVQLTPEQYQQYLSGTKKVLETYNSNPNKYNYNEHEIPNNIEQSDERY